MVRILLRQGLPFRGHDESKKSKRKGLFIEFLRFLAAHDEVARPFVLKEDEYFNCTSPTTQKALTGTCSYLTTKLILDELVKDNESFSLLVDGSHDVSVKQRYVNKGGLFRDFSGWFMFLVPPHYLLRLLLMHFLQNVG